MNKRRVLILAAALLAGLALATGALAQGTPAIDWWVFSGGGGEASGAEVMVNSALGQPIIGPASGDAISLGAGYWYGAQGPTAVTLVSFEATTVGGDILVEWETAIEIDTVGFNLYRAQSPESPYVKLNDTLIPSQSPGSVFGATYTWLDEDVQDGVTYYYKLEELEVGGRRNWYGPVSTDDDNPTSVILFRATAGRTGFTALAWWLVGAAVVVGAGLVVAWLAKRRH